MSATFFRFYCLYWSEFLHSIFYWNFLYVKAFVNSLLTPNTELTIGILDCQFEVILHSCRTMNLINSFVGHFLPKWCTMLGRTPGTSSTCTRGSRTSWSVVATLNRIFFMLPFTKAMISARKDTTNLVFIQILILTWSEKLGPLSTTSNCFAWRWELLNIIRDCWVTWWESF